MIAYGTMQKSAAWKLYAKSRGIPFEIANAVSEQIKRYEMAVKHADEDSKDEISVYDYIDKEYQAVYEQSKDYLGLVTSWSIAPCSYLLYQGSIRWEIGLVKVKDHLCCIMDGHWAEDCHFLKNDLLKVSVVDLIYRAYHHIGMEPPTVTELLNMCPPEDAAWDIYAKGCTLGINQCEQTGTAARVAKYAPRNISELGAFVAAIRPGCKSLYKTFEARKPFSYGVEAFDNLIQTEEFPNSFLLYQEQEMAALHFAGIDMGDCYTAIKNIAKKRAEKVLAYKDAFIGGFFKAIVKEGKSEDAAKKLSNDLWNIIEDSASYSFNASHSYCVALDSLYCAWLKAHHPLAFYTVLLTLAQEKGDKDRMNALKDEAESFFGIHFPPFRYGQDNRTIKEDAEHNAIINSLAAIKGYSPAVGKILYDCSRQNLACFSEVLRWLDTAGIKDAKVRPLVYIDYFSEFGDINELLCILDAWNLLKQGAAKLVARDKVPDLLKPSFEKYCSATNKDGTTAASYRIGDNLNELLMSIEDAAHRGVRRSTMRERISYCFDILGYVDVATGLAEDRRKLLITDCTPLKDNGGNVWGYRVGTRSLGSGKTARLTVRAATFNKEPIKTGDIVYATEVYKNNSGYWYLNSYWLED